MNDKWDKVFHKLASLKNENVMLKDDIYIYLKKIRFSREIFTWGEKKCHFVFRNWIIEERYGLKKLGLQSRD